MHTRFLHQSFASHYFTTHIYHSLYFDCSFDFLPNLVQCIYWQSWTKHAVFKRCTVTDIPKTYSVLLPMRLYNSKKQDGCLLMTANEILDTGAWNMVSEYIISVCHVIHYLITINMPTTLNVDVIFHGLIQMVGSVLNILFCDTTRTTTTWLKIIIAAILITIEINEMYIFYINILIFNFDVFYMFRTRGFVFRKPVVYTGMV